MRTVDGQDMTQSSRPSLRLEVLRQRYLAKDPQGNIIETPRRMLARVAEAVASVEAQYGADAEEVLATARRFLRMMRRALFLPNSPTLMNAGRKGGMCCACFVLPIEDSIEGIFEAVKQTAHVQKAGGGTGFSFDRLRPTGDYVASSGGRTSGPVSFWRVFSVTTKGIQQGAHRRGANMAMLRIDHPDVLKFILAKRVPGDFENFNVSIKVPNAFMELLQKDPQGHHVVTNPRDRRQYVIPKTIDLANYGIQDLLPPGETVVSCFTRAEIWEMLVSSAHASGEPGVCFIDRVNEDNPTPFLGQIEATNPCGEQPLLAHEACNLGSINLARFVLPGGSGMDWNGLRETVRLAVRFLDNVVDLTSYPTQAIREKSMGNRKIGLGVMGFADCLILMGLRYDSEKAVAFASEVSRFIRAEAHQASQDLADKRGNFPNWTASTWCKEHQRPMRNASVTTIAPTGSISILANCSSGIEPLFSLAYRRRALDGKEFIQVHPLLESLGRKDGWMTDAIRQAMLDGTPARDILGIPRKLAEVLVTAHQIAPEWHVEMQAAFQANTDNAVSKTVNLPATATVRDVDRIFRMAFAKRCKGITVYRDGSRAGQTFSGAKALLSGTGASGVPRPRGRVTSGQTFKFR
ncbi:MAG: adenosylcobalamin-dependent ribonucleoside-diphosphate reductase, partial [Planctomycetota bacterium]|nr:adenosylcobalamin-dependent ribonucleoside-diphosphate reductase [Planctomycetota bacterium]